MQEIIEYRRSIFNGNKIKLRGITEEDKKKLAKIWNEESVLIGNRASIIPTYESNDVSKLEEWGANKDYSGFGLSIVDQEDNLVGLITLFGIMLPHMVGTIAIMISEKYQNFGYGQEALLKGLELAFKEYNCHKVELYVYSYNDRAIHVYEKLGFVVEGRKRECIYKNGKYYDIVNMGILRSEYLIEV